MILASGLETLGVIIIEELLINIMELIRDSLSNNLRATMIKHAIGILFNPNHHWQAIADLPNNQFFIALIYTALLSCIPAAAWYYGTTEVGWQVGDSEAIKMTSKSALNIFIVFYFVMLATVATIGYFLHWMSHTYGAESTFLKGMVIAGLTASPLFLSGAIGVYPSFATVLVVGVGALAWAIYLLYVGIPLVMHIPKEQGFLFSSAVVAVALVVFVAIMVGSVILLDSAIGPEFTD